MQCSLPQTVLLLFSLKTLQSAEYVLHSTETVIKTTNGLYIAKVRINFQSSCHSSFQQHMMHLIAFSYGVFFFFNLPLWKPKPLGFPSTFWLPVFSLFCWFIFSPLISNCYTSVFQHLPFLDDLMASDVTYVLMNPKFYTFKLNLSYELHSCISTYILNILSGCL